jgi:hypothetical protein
MGLGGTLNLIHKIPEIKSPGLEFNLVRANATILRIKPSRVLINVDDTCQVRTDVHCPYGFLSTISMAEHAVLGRVANLTRCDHCEVLLASLVERFALVL